MTIDKSQVALGESVNVTLVVTNVSNQTQVFSNQNGDLNFNFLVLNRALGDAVGYSHIIGPFPKDDTFVTLAPNENYTQDLVWNEQWESNIAKTAPPGVYQITGVTSGGPYEFETTPLNITITASSTPSPTLSPSVPELPTCVIPLIFAAIATAVVTTARGKKQSGRYL